ncbi:C-X-C chemokine receptor type 3-like [Brienomyrus brachyistius]|uniref:C-X-C chemokine receptor type 3-like n=1 Tax=Brienomyrus brachyistius TaxID=42636 RepID=UPI0020B1C47B|nr:C-X-C chemokine receptor type 3-like [Brienomyrus brachyistius]
MIEALPLAYSLDILCISFLMHISVFPVLRNSQSAVAISSVSCRSKISTSADTSTKSKVMDNVTKFKLELDGLFLENATYDYNDYKIDVDNFEQVRSVFIPTLYSLVLVGGLLGNVLVLVVLCWSHWRRSYMDIFVLHLSVADLLLLITLPFWAAEAAQGWVIGTPLCKLMGAIFKISFFCGIILLACISLDRYLSIVHGVQMYSCRKPWQVHASCLFFWFFCLILSIPDWVFLEQQYRERFKTLKCDYNYKGYSTNGSSLCLASHLLYFTLGFLIPTVVMIFSHVSILLLLHSKSQKLQTQKSLLLIRALVVSYFICWTPFSITLMVDTMYRRKDLDYSETPVALSKALVLTTALCYLHTLLNPILYTCLCVNFRQHVLHRLRLSSTSPPDHQISLWDDPIVPEEKYIQQMVDKGKTCY